MKLPWINIYDKNDVGNLLQTYPKDIQSLLLRNCNGRVGYFDLNSYSDKLNICLKIYIYRKKNFWVNIYKLYFDKNENNSEIMFLQHFNFIIYPAYSTR